MQCPPYLGAPVQAVSLTQQQAPYLSPTQAAGLAVLKNQYRITSWPYYSRVKFYASKVASEVGFQYTLAQGALARAFSYSVGETRQPGGFTGADGPATIADTNLTQRNQTTGGQNVLIHGIAIQVVPAALHLDEGQQPPARVRPTDHQFLSALFETVSVELSLNGDENRFRLGSIGQIPGAGGLVGAASDTTGQAGLAGYQKDKGFANNGWTVRTNFFRVPEGLIWRNQSNADSQLNVIFTNTRPIQIWSGGSIENAAGNSAKENGAEEVATGNNGYTYPSEVAVELLVHLIGKVEGPRTRSV